MTHDCEHDINGLPDDALVCRKCGERFYRIVDGPEPDAGQINIVDFCGVSAESVIPAAGFYYELLRKYLK